MGLQNRWYSTLLLKVLLAGCVGEISGGAPAVDGVVELHDSSADLGRGDARAPKPDAGQPGSRGGDLPLAANDLSAASDLALEPPAADASWPADGGPLIDGSAGVRCAAAPVGLAGSCSSKDQPCDPQSSPASHPPAGKASLCEKHPLPDRYYGMLWSTDDGGHCHLLISGLLSACEADYCGCNKPSDGEPVCRVSGRTVQQLAHCKLACAYYGSVMCS